MKTVTNNTSTMYRKLGKIIEKLDSVSNDVIDGTISANSIYDRIEKIRADIENIQESL